MAFDKENHIDITGVDLIKLAKTAYSLSRPQGLGFLHYQDGELTDEEAGQMINQNRPHIPLSMDYVKGRACKLTVFCDQGITFIRNQWHDHSDQDLCDLVSRVKA